MIREAVAFSDYFLLAKKGGLPEKRNLLWGGGGGGIVTGDRVQGVLAGQFTPLTAKIDGKT